MNKSNKHFNVKVELTLQIQNQLKLFQKFLMIDSNLKPLTYNLKFHNLQNINLKNIILVLIPLISLSKIIFVQQKIQIFKESIFISTFQNILKLLVLHKIILMLDL
ncbi:unnamed protein product [Paramecium sonneborni]|uniref:Transmembrane protein n=1 Tax=Paramecium sonneborni TaxID=65129 RepID=A0A8S1PJS4_9CILI|nr:unnamed protein product [Paramecium sonneborni]